MKKFVIFICIIALAYTEDVVLPPEPTVAPPTSTSVKPPDTTTHAPVPVTNATTTTAAPITTSTTKATTTPASTTTAAPTTPATTTKATTPAPKPTPKPTPKKPEVLKFNVTNDKNVTCILLNMAVMFKIPYETNNGTKHAEVIVPTTATSNGTCGEAVQKIQIQWKPDKTQSMDMIELEFVKNDTKKEYMVSKFSGELFIDNENFPNATDNKTITFLHTKSEFTTPLRMSYKCDKEEPFNMSLPTNINVTVATLVVSNLRIEAFHNSTGHVFSSAEDCEPFQSSGIVPIAVGCSLAVLIVIVLIAYLIGRRRSQARGYLSMFSERQREEEYIPMKNLSCFGQ